MSTLHFIREPRGSYMARDEKGRLYRALPSTHKGGWAGLVIDGTELVRFINYLSFRCHLDDIKEALQQEANRRG